MKTQKDVIWYKIDPITEIPAIRIGEKSDDPYWSDAEATIPLSHHTEQVRVLRDALEEIIDPINLPSPDKVLEIAKSALAKVDGET